MRGLLGTVRLSSATLIFWLCYRLPERHLCVTGAIRTGGSFELIY